MVISKKIVFTVSLCAMLAVNPVLATDPSDTQDANDTVGTKHNVYVEGTFEGRMDSGIAGVTYVNKAMDAAGYAAQAAEGHAAAAGTSALSAAKSAGEAAKSAKAANEALSGKVDVDQGDENANKVMVTDSDGTVYPGYVTVDNITTAFTDGSGNAHAGLNGDVLVVNGNGKVGWMRIGPDSIDYGAVTSGAIADFAVTTNKIADGAIHSGHIANGAVIVDKIYAGGYSGGVLEDAYPGYVLKSVGNSGVAVWGQLDSRSIANGAIQAGHIADDAIYSGHIVQGAIHSGHIADGAVIADKIYAGGYTGGVLEDAHPGYVLKSAGNSGVAVWGQLDSQGIANDAIHAGHIADDAIYSGHITAGAIYSGHIADGAVTSAKIANDAVTSAKIADGAVTIEKTDGVVGMVPVGSADATTYANFWIEE